MSARLRTIEIIGVPMDLGANMAGTAQGPSILRSAGLIHKLRSIGKVVDSGDIVVPRRESFSCMTGCDYILPIADVLKNLMTSVKNSLDEQRLPLIIGGDHSLAIGTISALAAHLGEKKAGLLWIDAHADFNIPSTSPTGNVHGMPLAVVTGKGHDILVGLGDRRVRILPKNISLVGLRSIDALEKDLLRASGINCFTMRDIESFGIENVSEQAIARATDGTDCVHLSFDLDSLDPAYAPGVSVPEPKGLSMRDARYLLEQIGKKCELSSMDFVEFNPLVDRDHLTSRACIELISAVLTAR